MDKRNTIIVRGARQHNLKDITVHIPRNKLVVFTGVSGSGKSSLAFDTIYAEGQRRYVESLSAYARQFLGIMDKPNVDSIEGLSPAISIDQKSRSHNPRSTVGTVTEIYDYLRLLYARVGHPHCPRCGREIARQSAHQIADSLTRLAVHPARFLRIWILAPVVRDRKGEFNELFDTLRKQGYQTVRVDGRVQNLEDDFVLIKTNRHSIEVVVDRLVIDTQAPADVNNRITESVEAALRLGHGNIVVSQLLDPTFEMPKNPQSFKDHLFSERFACPECGISLPELEPRIFSFNSPHGACAACSGIGTLLEVDPELVFNPSLTIAEGGILPWNRLATNETWFSRLLEAVASTHNFSTKLPMKNLDQETLNLLLSGSDATYRVRGENRFGRVVYYDTPFEGISKHLMRRYKETESDYIRQEIAKFMSVTICPSCKGMRLAPESLSVTVAGDHIGNVARKSIKELAGWTSRLLDPTCLSERETLVGTPIIKEIMSRVQFLVDVGLDYLTLDRTASTLAGGESQRIRLASQIGTGLTGVLYVLDEPSIGLHQRDNDRLIQTLKKLRDLGNSVIVVEHDRDMIQAADWIIDFGPGAGVHGGRVVSEGTPDTVKRDRFSITGQYLAGKKRVTSKKLKAGLLYTPKAPIKQEPRYLSVRGAREHNLKNIDAAFPIGMFIAVTGVSGSGKSSLVHDVLYKALAQRFYHSKEKAGVHNALEGVEHVDKAILIDQAPIGRTPRSNPATYTGVFTHIRELFARTQEARIRGYKPGRFSFNVKGGRCETCEGEGQIKIEMQFLADVYVTCEVCEGSRYNEEALEIHFKEKSIADVLNMTVEHACKFFENIPAIRQKLTVLADVGLSYIRLGQSAPSLSGGEAQRVKLAAELSRRPTYHTLYILDEPTTGLHFADIERLLSVLRRLTDMGNTVIVIEHNTDVIRNTDWIIDLGPEGGDQGGEVIAQGTPTDVAAMAHSFTGQYLTRVLGL